MELVITYSHFLGIETPIEALGCRRLDAQSDEHPIAMPWSHGSRFQFQSSVALCFNHPDRFAMTSFLVTLAFLLSELAYADWRNTVNKAGEQMILSEKMTKDRLFSGAVV